MCKFLLIIVIGMIMPQVNVLPINVSQSIEKKDELTSFDSNTSNDDFSQYIDLHLNKNKKAESNNKLDSVNPEAKNSKSTIGTKSDMKQSDGLVGKTDKTDETDDAILVQKIAATGKQNQTESNSIDQNALTDSEQLMSFLTKADNTLVNQSIDSSSNTSSPEQLTAEQKAHYEAQLLLKASGLVADLSPVAKTVVSEQAAPEMVAPTSTKQTVSDEEFVLSNEAKATGKEATEATIVKSPAGAPAEGKEFTQAAVSVDLVKSSDKKTVLPEPGVESKAELISPSKVEPISQSITDVKQTNISSDKINAAQQQASQPLSSKLSSSQRENDLLSNTDKGTSLTVEQKLTKKTEMDNAQVNNDKTGQLAREKEVNQSSIINAVNDKQTTENKVINNSAATQIDTKNSTKSDSEKSLEKAVERIEKQVNSSKEAKQDKVLNSSEPQLIKSDLTQSNEATKANEAVNAKRVVTSNNQLASSHDDANKTQIKQDEKAQLATSFAEQSQQKAAAQKEGEILVEDKIIASVKGAPTTASHFIDVSGKATQTPQQIIEQQSAEMLNPSVATEVTQNQKTNTQLHQETISLFRKDATEAVKDKVMLMISQKLQRFDITLDPPELGNMQIRVNLQGEQAVVNFLVQSQQTKDALEQNMHKLRELLAEQGVDVGDANVEQQSANGEDSSSGNNSQMEGKPDNIAEANDVVAHTLSAKMIDSSTTRVDYYA